MTFGFDAPRGCPPGTMWTTADVTFGGGTKAERLTVIAIRGLDRHCAATDSRP